MADTWKRVWVDIDDDVIERDDPFEIIGPLWWDVDIYTDLENFEKTSARFTEPQKHVHAICWYDAEVNNGGHLQFFTNSTGIVWRRALEGLKSAGMTAHFEILSSALAHYGGALPFERDAREKIIDDSGVDFSRQDDDYYRFETEQLEARLMDYIRLNRDAFKCSGFIQTPVGEP